MPALLEQARVGGVRVLEHLQRRQRVRDALQVAQRHGAHVQQVAMSWKLFEQAIGGGQCVVELDAARSAAADRGGPHQGRVQAMSWRERRRWSWTASWNDD